MSRLEPAGTHQVEPVDAPVVPPAAPAATVPAAPLVNRLTLDLLEWIASRPRTYAETMEAWRTSCPRFPIWEDALDDGLVRVVSQSGTPMDQTRVSLTARGRAILDGH